MGTFVVKPERGVDFYVGWSSVVEAPVWWGNRAEATACLKEDERRDQSTWAENRLARADEHGTSLLGREEGGWDDSGFIYEQRGWLPRRHLAEVCRLLAVGNEPGVWDLLEPFEDETAVRRDDARSASGVAYRCPGVASTGHGLTEATTHAAGCCDRFADLPAAEQAATGPRYPDTAPKPPRAER